MKKSKGVHYNLNGKKMNKIEMYNWLNEQESKKVYEERKEADLLLRKELENNKSNNNVYFIKMKDTNWVKIGISKNPKERLAGMQTSNPKKLIMFAVINTHYAEAYESILHRLYKNINMQGEWFDFSDNINLMDNYCINTNDTFLSEIERFFKNKFPIQFEKKGLSLIIRYMPQIKHFDSKIPYPFWKMKKVLGVNNIEIKKLSIGG